MMEAMMELEYRVERLEGRVERLEAFAEDAKERLVRIETRLDGMATKVDLAALETRLLKWFIATAVTLTALAFAAGRYLD